jgi:PKD repeat protein
VYYVDLGYSDIGGTFGVSKIRRIRFIQSNQPPFVSASANPTSGPVPLTVNFSSAGSSDPENQPLSYAWTFGDSTTSTQANPTHTYSQAGQYSARLSVSDGVNTSVGPPIDVRVGNTPTAQILSPTDGLTFQAGDVITFSGSASDTEDGTLAASRFSWAIDFLHDTHVHPGVPITGVKNGTFTIPSSGHDFSGTTRYRITLTVTDSDGLTASRSVTIFPRKVNLTFNTSPSGLTLYLDGIAKTASFVYDTLVGFNHSIEARDQTSGATTYTFGSWSDGGAQTHTVVVPTTAQSYTATYAANRPAAPLAFVQIASVDPQFSTQSIQVAFTQAQSAGDTNILAIGWNDMTSTITSVTDSAGNVYQLAAPRLAANGLSQAIYYAANITAAPAGGNTVTVQFNQPAAFADLRVAEYSGLDPASPLDVVASASGTSGTASSGSATTTAPKELIFGAGMTLGAFSGPGSGFTLRVITQPDADIAEDRIVTAAGANSATAAVQGPWVMQMATFKAAGP